MMMRGIKKFALALVAAATLFAAVCTAHAQGSVDCRIADVHKTEDAQWSYEVDILRGTEGEPANIAVAFYASDGSLLSVNIDKINSAKSGAVISGAMESSEKPAYAKTFALSAGDSLKPLGKADKYYVKDEAVTVRQEDIDSIDSDRVKYYPSAEGEETAVIRLARTFGLEINSLLKNTDASAMDLQSAINNSCDSYIEFRDTNGDERCDVVNIIEYTHSVVDDINTEKGYIAVDEGKIYFNFVDPEITTVIEDENGRRIGLEDISVGDVVSYYYDSQRTRYDYIKIVKIANGVVKGSVEGTTIKYGINYIKVNGKDIRLPSDYDFGVIIGDNGTFFVGIGGMLFDFAKDIDTSTIGYILDAVKTDSLVETWQVRMLTANDGVKIFDFTPKTNEQIKDYISNNGITQKYSDAVSDGDLDNKARLVNYSVNTDGYISKIESGANVGDVLKFRGMYDSKTRMFGNSFGADSDALVFDITADKSENTSAGDISKLSDGNIYSGIMLANSLGDGVVIAYTSVSQYVEKDGLAVVTGAQSVVYGDEEAVRVDYFKNGKSGSVIITDDTRVSIGYSTEYTNARSMQTGDVFTFAATDGVASEYGVIAKIDSNGLLDISHDALNALDADCEIYYGYINNDKKLSGSGETLDVYVNGNVWSVSVLADAYKYTYDNGARKPQIVVGDVFGTDSTDYRVDDDATMIFVYMLQGSVVDSYTFTNRVTIDDSNGKASINGSPVNTLYRDEKGIYTD